MIVISIGGNDFDFEEVIKSCVQRFVLVKAECWENKTKDLFTTAKVKARTKAIENAIKNVRQAMTNAGHAVGTYSIMVQTYPSPIPSSGLRYPETNVRQFTGGCGIGNADIRWANDSLLLWLNTAVRRAVYAVNDPNIRMMDVQRVMNGRRLCESTVGLLEEKGLASWKAPGAVDTTEWISHIRYASTVGTPYFKGESLHPNYWGQLALRNCLRQAYNNGNPVTKACERSATGLTAAGEPKMKLVPLMPIRRPDARIFKSGGPLKGNQIYVIGHDDQKVNAVTVGKGSKGVKVFTVSIENDGDLSDTYRIKGCATSSPGGRFATEYFIGSKNVTSSVAAGTYTSPPVPAGNTMALTVRISPQKNSIAKAHECPVRVSSTSDSSAVDQVVARIQRTA
jgi:hypothetical protein